MLTSGPKVGLFAVVLFKNAISDTMKKRIRGEFMAYLPALPRCKCEILKNAPKMAKNHRFAKIMLDSGHQRQFDHIVFSL